MMRKFFIFLLFIVASARPAFSSELLLAALLNEEPYNNINKQSGIETEIIRAALNSQGLNVSALDLHRNTLEQMIKKDLIAGAYPVSPNTQTPMFVSDSHISYQHHAITLKDKEIEINDISDLKGLRIVAFPLAQHELPKAFKDTIPQMKSYKEFRNESTQIQMLYQDNADVLIADIYVFDHYKRQLLADKNISAFRTPVFHNILPLTYYAVAFTQEDTRDTFNEGLRAIRTSGVYDNIIINYLSGSH